MATPPVGWLLPNFDDSSWTDGTPIESTDTATTGYTPDITVSDVIALDAPLAFDTDIGSGQDWIIGDDTVIPETYTTVTGDQPRGSFFLSTPISGWLLPNFDDSAWTPATALSAPAMPTMGFTPNVTELDSITLPSFILVVLQDTSQQYGTSDNPDTIDDSMDPNLDSLFETSSFRGPSYGDLSAMRVATDGSHSASINSVGCLIYIDPADGSGGRTVCVFPTLLSTKIRTYVYGVTYVGGTWWALIKQVNEIADSGGNLVTVDVGVFIVTATIIDPSSEASWTLFRTIQANSGTEVGICNGNLVNALQGNTLLGTYTSGQLTDLIFPEMVIRFADGTGVLIPDGQSIPIPGGVPGTFTVGASPDGTIVANGGVVTFITITVGDKGSTWTVRSESQHFYNGGVIEPANVGTTIALVAPATVLTADGAIGGVDLTSGSGFALSGAATAGLTVSGIPSDPLYGLALYYYTEYLTIAGGDLVDSDYRQLGIGDFGTGDVSFLGGNQFVSSVLEEAGLGNLGISTINDHGTQFNSERRFQCSQYTCTPTVAGTYLLIEPADTFILGIGAEGVCLQFGETVNRISGTSTSMSLGSSDGTDISAALGPDIGHYDFLLARFDGTQNIPIWVGGLIIDSDVNVDASTFWLGCCDDGSDGIYAVDGSTGDLMHRAGDHTHGWDLVVASLTGLADTILLMQVLPDTSILCVHGSSGSCQVDNVLSGAITAGPPFSFPTSEINSSVFVSEGSSGFLELESNYTTAAWGSS
jgi:hypothetical protein